MNKIIIFIAVVIIGSLAILWLQSDDMVDDTRIGEVDTEIEENNQDIPLDENVADVVIDMSATGRVFIVDGEENPTISVNQGDLVELRFEVTGGTHDFVVDELGVTTDVLNVGQNQTIVFEASEAGVFEYYCSVGAHRDDGMFGVFEVVAVN